MNNKTSFLVTLAFILLYNLNAQIEPKEHDSFKTICENADAYLMHYYIDVTYTNRFFGYKRYISNSKKMVINNSQGVETFAFLDLSPYESNHLESVKVRTLKADGTIMDLDSSLVFQRSSPRDRFGVIHYPIPGVEPGDTIDVSYSYYENLSKTERMDYVNLFTEIPSLDSQYTITTSPDQDIRYKPYNDFPKPQVVANDSILYVQFSMDKVKGLRENENHCIPCEQPYFYYSLEDKNDELRSWKDVYNEEFNFLTQPLSIDREKVSYYKKWKRDILAEAKDSSKYFKLNRLHEEVVRNFIMKPSKKEEFVKSTGYFLKQKRFDPISIRRFYRQILEDLEIDYWAVFGRTRQAGTIDPYYIRKGEFDHIFFAYKDEQGSLHFLYPHEEYYQYLIDEIPTNLYNTLAILVKPNRSKKLKRSEKSISKDLRFATVDSVSVAEITLPGMDATQNYVRQVISADINTAEKKNSARYRFKISGGLSTELRSFYSVLGQDQEVSDFYQALEEVEGEDTTIKIDTITNRVQDIKRPFSFNVSGKGSLNNALTFISDSLVSISVDRLITHNMLEHTKGDSYLNYYLNYSYSDMMLMYLNFPHKIEVMGLEDVDEHYTNDFSAYTFEIKQTKNNQLQLRSNYKILKDLIPKENLDELNLLNETVKKVKGTRIIVKVIPDAD